MLNTFLGTGSNYLHFNRHALLAYIDSEITILDIVSKLNLSTENSLAHQVYSNISLLFILILKLRNQLLFI